jgi:transcription factor SFP1
MVPTTQAPTSHADPAANTQHGFRAAQGTSMNSFAYKQQRRGSEGFNRTNLSTVQDMDSLEDMEMDDVNPLSPIGEQEPFSPQQQQAFGQGSTQIPQLNINVANTLANQVRNSTPNTPLATSQSFGFQNNPTVSSVNTPTLGTQSVQQQQRTPDSSVPGTPAELDPEFAMNFMGGLNMPMGNQMIQDGNMNFNLGFGGLGGYDGTIDQPAKRLFSKTGPSGLTQAQLALALRQNQAGGDSELAKRLREQAILANAAGMPFQEENKPFRCPVIGCEKAYKNQNGLKYHKQVSEFVNMVFFRSGETDVALQHGHQNQQLKENEDGTFSIVDPVTSIPYPGTVGMEKEKPYRCEVCGKRYKNLNGLKYHRQHSAPCNPELKLNNLNLASLQNLQGLNMNANVAGAGLAGMGDSGMNF